MAWKWSQVQLAAAIHSNQKTLSRWELDRQEPSDLALGLLAGLFGLEVESLRTGQGFQLPNPPQQIGKMLVADSAAANLLGTPSLCSGRSDVDRPSGGASTHHLGCAR